MSSNKTLKLVATIPSILFVLVLLGAHPLIASETAGEPETVSLTIEEKPLGEILEMIADQSGYTLSIDSEFENLPVSASFENLTLHQALRRVLGTLNRYVIIDETNRTVAFRFTDEPTISDIQTAAEKGSPEKIPAVDVVPPDENSVSPAIIDVKKIRTGQSDHQKEELELIPPESSGQKMPTYKASAKKIKPNDRPADIIPPDPGGNGVTSADLERLKKRLAQETN